MVLIYVSGTPLLCYPCTMNSWAIPNLKWALLWREFSSQVFSCHHTSWSVHSSVPFELLEIPSTKNHTATPVGSEVFVFGVLVNKKRLVRNPANQLRLIHKNTYSWWNHHLFIPVFFKVFIHPRARFQPGGERSIWETFEAKQFFYTENCKTPRQRGKKAGFEICAIYHQLYELWAHLYISFIIFVHSPDQEIII